jgi:hypothetical protein
MQYILIQGVSHINVIVCSKLLQSTQSEFSGNMRQPQSQAIQILQYY